MFICTCYEEVVESMKLESIICDESIIDKQTQHSVTLTHLQPKYNFNLISKQNPLTWG